jgi:hypothetical protein
LLFVEVMHSTNRMGSIDWFIQAIEIET